MSGWPPPRLVPPRPGAREALATSAAQLREGACRRHSSSLCVAVRSCIGAINVDHIDICGYKS